VWGRFQHLAIERDHAGVTHEQPEIGGAPDDAPGAAIAAI
jgi:hypothetical protein